jgi:CubicO group peptidase (beta-lactamase class C family)
MTLNLLSHSEVISKIDLFTAWLESQMTYCGQPGISVGIVYDQELVWAKGFGFANLEQRIAATPQTIYRIASITKLFTSTAILQLRDAGKLQLDDPIKRHLPWFSVQNQFEDTPSITIQHLITHTSGLPRESAFPYWTDAQFPSREQMIQKLSSQSAIFPTETEWKYSNLGVSLAGEIVAAVSGMEYTDYIEQNILMPLGMKNTFVKTIDEKHPSLAVGYGRRLPDHTRKIALFEDCKGITPAANIATNVEDLARFAMLQFRGGPAGGAQILRGSTLREMHRIHWLDPNWVSGWGLGFHIEHRKGKTFVGHGGSLMGYRTSMLTIPEDKIAVIVLTNADDGIPDKYSEKAFEWIAPSIIKNAAPKPEVKTADPGWNRYVGRYRSIWGDEQVLIFNGELIAIDPSVLDPMEDYMRLIPVSEHTFRMVSKNGYSGKGELAVFEIDENGTVKRMKTGDNYSMPVEKW